MNLPTDTTALLHHHPRRWLDAVAGPNHGVRVPVRVGPFRLETEVTFGAAWILADGTVWRTIAITTLTAADAPSRRLPRATAEVSVDPASGALRYAGREVEGGRLGARRLAGRVADRVGDRIEAAARDATTELRRSAARQVRGDAVRPAGTTAPRAGTDGGARLSARTVRTGRRVGAAAGTSRPAAPTRRTERTCVSKA